MSRFLSSRIASRQKNQWARFETLENRQLLAADIYYYATSGGDVVNSDETSLRVTNHDIVELTVEQDGSFRHEVFFNGDSVGLENPASNLEAITAFAFDNTGALLIATQGRATVGGINTDVGDILRFVPSSLGAQTSGRWEHYFDASRVGFPETGNSPFRIDALDVLDDGRLVLSVGGNPVRGALTVPIGGFNVTDKDLLSFRFSTPSSTGSQTAGTWSMYATDDQLQLTRTLGTTDENVTAVWIDQEVAGLPDLLVSTAENFLIEQGGGSGSREDVAILRRPSQNGSVRFAGLEIDGSERGLDNDSIHAFQKADPEISIADASIVEGQTGGRFLNFRVTLNEPTSKTVRVNYQTVGGTASPSSDFASKSGVVSWGPGRSGTRLVQVRINGDVQVEGDERLRVVLSNPINAELEDAVGVGTIINDDIVGGLPELRISDVRQAEGSGGGKNFVFTVTPSRASTGPMAVNFQTVNGTATTTDRDYVAGSGQLNWPSNSTSPRRIFVWVRGDTQNEPNENFTVRLSGATNATIADGNGLATIVDDDANSPPPTQLPGLRIGDVRAVEGTGSGKNFVFTVNLNQATTAPVSVDYSTSDGSATRLDRDYVTTTGTLSWPAGTSAPRRVFVWVRGDTDAEANENFFVRLSNAQNARIDDGVGQGTILNDDALQAVAAVVDSEDTYRAFSTDLNDSKKQLGSLIDQAVTQLGERELLWV